MELARVQPVPRLVPGWRGILRQKRREFGAFLAVDAAGGLSGQQVGESSVDLD